MPANPPPRTVLHLQEAGCGGLRGLSFAVAAGEVLGLLGADPATLTAVMETLAGLRPAEAGSVAVDGHAPAQTSRQAPADADTLEAVEALLAARPPLLLLDQPAAALGAGPRARLLDLLARRDTPETAIVYAATEAAELFAVADRIAALADGTLAQLGTPRDIYDRPASLAVARLGGALNELGGVLLDSDETGCRVRLDEGPEIDMEVAAEGLSAGSRCVLCLRPERMAASLLPAEQLGAQALAARLRGARFMGDHVALELATARATLLVRRHAALPPRDWPADGSVSVAWTPHDALIFPPNANAA